MISAKNSLIVFVIGTAAIGLSISPSVSYAQTSSNSSAVMNTTSAIPQLQRLCGFTPPAPTITPAPVKAGTTFTISGKLIDLITGRGIGHATIDFHAGAIPGGRISIPSALTSSLILPTFSLGTFQSSATAPAQAGLMGVIATSHPTGYYPCFSFPATDVITK
jgi:hypothetical protein